MTFAFRRKKSKGTIHNRRRQFFRVFDTPLPYVCIFSLLSIGKFQAILILPPTICQRLLWRTPPKLKLELHTALCVTSSVCGDENVLISHDEMAN